MFRSAVVLGQVELVDRPALGQSWQPFPTYSGQQPVNGGQSSSIAPGSSVDCSDSARYQNEVDSAAARIASSQKAMQNAVAAGDQGAIDRANIAANQANQDWEVWSQAIRKCKGDLPAKGPAIGPIIALLAAVAVVGSVIVLPKLMK